MSWEKMYLHAHPTAPAPPIKKPPIKNTETGQAESMRKKNREGEGNVGAQRGGGRFFYF